jgi:predicted metalloprotease with PDZ domain
MMRSFVVGVFSFCVVIAALSGTMEIPTSTTSQTRGKAHYKIRLISLSPLKLTVSADIPINDKMLRMDITHPADLPEMAAKGWPVLISNLSVCDTAGKRIDVTAIGPNGWQLTDSMQSRLKLNYDIDYSLFAASRWSSALESAFADEDHALVVGRSIFITTAQIGAVEVEFETPKGWIAVMPWPADDAFAGHYNVRSREDLINNMLVFSKIKPDVVTADGFRLQIIAMGHWQPLQPLVSRVLGTIIKHEVALMQYKGTEIYNVVLLPISDEGGNAFRQSFVYCYNNPDQNNSGVWGNTLAHEIFHYWNYARLKGADYASSQWFQEGFTEYVANLVMVTGQIDNSDAFLSKLSEHVANYRKLATTLESPGTHKGPPLYSAGALVAFMWDVLIRKASGGERNIGDLFRNLMAQTDSGARKYAWADIRAALHTTADYNWEAFYQSHIKGHEPLLFDVILPSAGLRLRKLGDGSEKVDYDPTASGGAKALFQSLIGD